MKLVDISNREKFFNDNFPLAGFRFNQKIKCVHCNEIVNTKDYKVRKYEGFYEGAVKLIVCPNAPSCDGNALDFIRL